MDYTMIGGTVNLASRLEHEAPPGGILISFETHAQVQDQIRCEERGRVRVKGIAQPVMTYQVIGPNAAAKPSATAHLRLELDTERMSEDERPPLRRRCAGRSGCSRRAAKTGGR